MSNLMAKPVDPATLRADFPILNRRINGRRLVYLDNTATAQKPTEVIEAESRYYRETNANVHRGIHTLSAEATAAYEASRARVARFIGANDPTRYRLHPRYDRGTESPRPLLGPEPRAGG